MLYILIFTIFLFIFYKNLKKDQILGKIREVIGFL
jgi:hypothetical protein